MIVAYLIWSILIRFLAVGMTELLYQMQVQSHQRPQSPVFYEVLSWAIYFVLIVPIFRALP